jgi:hypothetical protein
MLDQGPDLIRLETGGGFVKLLRKFTLVLPLVGLSLVVAADAMAQQAAQAQQSAPAQPASLTAGTGNGADKTTAKPVPDATFHGVKLADAKGKQTDASLIFSDSSQTVLVRVADRDFLSIPYYHLDKFSYQYTKKHRVTQGAVVMVASLGAGAIVMLTKSKSHWLYVDFHEEATAKSVVLRMDKGQYKAIIEAVKAHTGKEVEFAQDTGKEKKEKKPEGSAGAE